MILDDEALGRQLLPLPTDWKTLPGLRSAAVLAPVFRRAGEDWLLLTQRPTDLAQHPGQIAFPGGQRDGDENPITCALRECHEELGQASADVTLLGCLPMRTSSSAFRVIAFVGRIPDPVDLQPDPSEVAAILEVPLGELLDQARWEDREYQTSQRRYRASPHFDHGEHTIWGLTARLTTDLLDAVRTSH